MSSAAGTQGKGSGRRHLSRVSPAQRSTTTERPKAQLDELGLRPARRTAQELVDGFTGRSADPAGSSVRRRLPIPGPARSGPHGVEPKCTGRSDTPEGKNARFGNVSSRSVLILCQKSNGTVTAE
jgi:hypothetical protein